MPLLGMYDEEGTALICLLIGLSGLSEMVFSKTYY